MSRVGWLERFVPVGIFVTTALLVALAASPLYDHAVPRAAAARACAADVGLAVATAAVGRAASALPVRVADKLGTRGEYLGRALRVTSARGTVLDIALPIESSVAQAVGNALAYTKAENGRSEVHVVDTATACDYLIARPAGVSRSAVLAPDGRSVYVHGVTAARADAGVTRYELDGAGTSSLVVPPLTADERFGRTFGTHLALSDDGGTLAVQSCGIHACRTRLLDLDSSELQTHDAAGQGAFIGVTADHLVTYGGCVGLPCPVIAIDRATGSTRALSEEAWSASLAARSDGSTVVSIETAAGVVEVTP